MNPGMQWAAASATSPNLSDAVSRAAEQIRMTLPDPEPDCCLAFVSPHYADSFPYLAALLREHLPARFAVGCSAAGVIGGGNEHEQTPAVSLAAARLPGVQVSSAHLDTAHLPDEDAPPEVWREWLGSRHADPRLLLVLAQPYAPRLDALLTGLDYAYPNAVVVGGVGGDGRAADQPVLFDGSVFDAGGVLLAAFSGNLAVDPVVAQGCRPIGRPLTITRCEHNVLMEVNGQKPLRYLADLVEASPDEDRALMRHSLFIGIRAEPGGAEADTRDYLIRNLVGIDYARGILAVGAPLREGMEVHFHLRDRHASAEDLRTALALHRGTRPAGALIFSCLGRGKRLYEEPNHDSRVFAETFGNTPLAGFFCNGEIGPVGGATCIHGYTSAFALIRPAAP